MGMTKERTGVDTKNSGVDTQNHGKGHFALILGLFFTLF
jgi:hypothetical protein